jgi:hypothetical protein
MDLHETVILELKLYCIFTVLSNMDMKVWILRSDSDMREIQNIETGPAFQV